MNQHSARTRYPAFHRHRIPGISDLDGKRADGYTTWYPSSPHNLLSTMMELSTATTPPNNPPLMLPASPTMLLRVWQWLQEYWSRHWYNLKVQRRANICWMFRYRLSNRQSAAPPLDVRPVSFFVFRIGIVSWEQEDPVNWYAWVMRKCSYARLSLFGLPLRCGCFLFLVFISARSAEWIDYGLAADQTFNAIRRECVRNFAFVLSLLDISVGNQFNCTIYEAKLWSWLLSLNVAAMPWCCNWCLWLSQ